jgi:HSP20 family protein
MGAEDFELTVVDDTVTLKGKRPGSDSSAGATLHRQERDAGQFIRTIQLPFGVEGDQVQARLQNGVLEVDLPRATSEKPRKITVKSA